MKSKSPLFPQGLGVDKLMHKLECRQDAMLTRPQFCLPICLERGRGGGGGGGGVGGGGGDIKNRIVLSQGYRVTVES